MSFIHAEMFYHEWNGLVTCLATLMGVFCIIGIALVILGDE